MTTTSLVLRTVVAMICAACAVSSSGQIHKPQTQRPCTQHEAIAADTDIDTLQTWSDVYRSFKKYAHCDDASIGEGYSDKVMRLLVHHWNELPGLAPLAVANASFRKFVIRHIDELASSEELRGVQQNAQSHCPSNSKRLCSDIDKRIRTILASP